MPYKKAHDDWQGKPAATAEKTAVETAFAAGFQAELQRLFALRRDVRTFRREAIDPALLAEALASFDTAPSVGLSQPWRLVRIDSRTARAAVTANFEAANATARAGYEAERSEAYAALKLAGLATAPVHLAVFCDADPAQGYGLGRMTMPEMAHASVVCAVMQFWLAARARGIGVGWVSILDPLRLKRDLDIQAGWDLVAYLCVGYPADVSDTPELERADWEHRRATSTQMLTR